MSPPRPPASPPAPIGEADLHAYVDGQLAAERRAEVEAFLASRPADRQRVEDWLQQKRWLKGLLDPVLSEALPLRLPTRPPAMPWGWRSLAAGVLVAACGMASGWWLHGAFGSDAAAVAASAASGAGVANGQLTGFALRAAVAHEVYSPDARRPVEVGVDQEQALVTWLTKRIGAPVRVPKLGDVGYELIGGRLLPGDKGPVAQFMYRNGGGERLTLYVTREPAAAQETAFRFGRDGPVNVFYWVDRDFGYALSASLDRDELLRVSQSVYRQLAPR